MRVVMLQKLFSNSLQASTLNFGAIILHGAGINHHRMVNDKRIQLLIAFGYDGGRFFGLAPQPGKPTAAAALKQRFLDAGVFPKALCFTSRTDAGVHALMNLATCWLKGPLDLPRVTAMIETERDDGLVGVQIKQVPVHIHARGLSRGKCYRYRVTGNWPPGRLTPCDRWALVKSLQLERMQQAASYFIGRHDFSSFGYGRARQQDPVREIRTIEAIQMDAGDGLPTIQFDIEGRSFLRQMVRIIVGTLTEVGAGLRDPDEMPLILMARDRRRAGVTAPACGLTLVSIQTEPRFF